MKNGYLVELLYDDGREYEATTNEWIIAVFENKEKAEDFCRSNSDDEEYNCYNNRTIKFENHAPIEIKFHDWYDSKGNQTEMYWFVIQEVDIV